MELNEIIRNTLFENSSIFLETAMEHINRGIYNSKKNEKLAIVGVQTAIEFILKLYVLNSHGLSAIVDSKFSSEKELNDLYVSNKLKTKKFNDLKKYVKSTEKTQNRNMHAVITYLQKIRNGIMHFEYTFDKEEMKKLQNILIEGICCSIVIYLDCIKDESENDTVIEYIAGHEYDQFFSTNKDLIKEYIEKHLGKTLYKCPYCFNSHLLPNLICLECFINLNYKKHYGFTNCLFCKNKTVMFDMLNIKDNVYVTGFCLDCQEYTNVHYHKKSHQYINIETLEVKDYFEIYKNEQNKVS